MQNRAIQTSDNPFAYLAIQFIGLQVDVEHPALRALPVRRRYFFRRNFFAVFTGIGVFPLAFNFLLPAGLADMVQLLRGHGARPKYFNRIVGYNSRLDALQAAILGVKLPYAAEWSRRRRAHADVYDRELAGVGDLVIPKRTAEAYHIFHQYTIATGKRDALQDHLRQAGIGSEIYYPQCLHLQECYAYLGGKVGDCPVAEREAGRVLSIPVFAEMTENEQAEVIDTIKAFFR